MVSRVDFFMILNGFREPVGSRFLAFVFWFGCGKRSRRGHHFISRLRPCRRPPQAAWLAGWLAGCSVTVDKLTVDMDVC